MQSRFIPITALIGVIVPATGLMVYANAKPAPRDPATPPPMLLELTIDGQTHDVPLGTPSTLTIHGRQVAVSIAAKPYRELAAAGVELHYPQHMAYEYDEGEGVTTYTMDGNDAVLMLQHYQGKITPAEALAFYVDGVSGMFGQANTHIGDTALQLAGKQVQGKRLRIMVAGNVFVQDVFAIAGPAGTLGIVVQDTPDDDGKTTAETRAMTDMLEKSFRVVD